MADSHRCNQIAQPHEAGANVAAENGAAARQLMAMFDWDTVSMAEVYTRSAEQKRLTGEAMFLISLERTAPENCRTDVKPVSHQLK